MKQYKTVAGPQHINVAKGNTQGAFNLFADIINREATDGWEYHSMELLVSLKNLVASNSLSHHITIC